MLYSRTWICYSQLSQATLCQSCSVHDLNKKKGRKQNWTVGNLFKVIILSVLPAKENKWKDPFIFCHSPHFWAISVWLLCRRSVCATAAWEGGGVKTAVPEDVNFGQPPKIGKMRPEQHRYALIIIDMCFLVACFPTFDSFLVLACEEVEYQCQLRSLKFAEFWTKIYWAKLRWTRLASRSVSLSNRLLSLSLLLNCWVTITVGYPPSHLSMGWH